MSAMDTRSWTLLFIAEFPQLSSEDVEIVEQPSRQYNCIAYAVGDTTEWWWPDGINYWPQWATLDNRMESLKEIFTGLGYEQCDDGIPEDGYQKVALYEIQGRFQHASIQMASGAWRSKMGKGPVIEHLNPESLSGGMYGSPTTYMRRALNTTPLQGTRGNT